MMSGGREPKFYPQKQPDPVPQPAVASEQIAAKDIARRKARKGGRSSQIFAGRLNNQILNFGKSRVGE